MTKPPKQKGGCPVCEDNVYLPCGVCRPPEPVTAQKLIEEGKKYANTVSKKVRWT